MDTTISKAVKELLRIVTGLRSTYPKKRFTLDGRLVGDLGETIVEGAYEIELYEGQQKHYDGKAADGRRVQIKATMQKSLSFPVDHIPDYYLGIKIGVDGEFEEIFNGPGAIAWDAVKERQPTKTNLHSVSINALRILNDNVPEGDRIPRRPS